MPVTGNSVVVVNDICTSGYAPATHIGASARFATTRPATCCTSRQAGPKHVHHWTRDDLRKLSLALDGKVHDLDVEHRSVSEGTNGVQPWTTTALGTRGAGP
jgi:hypothetical protein